MRHENRLALVVAFYLSKYDREGLGHLGYSTFIEAYRRVEFVLGVKTTTVKNMRDEYDALHDNDRRGWYQRPLPPSRRRIVDAMDHLDESTMRGIVIDMLQGHSGTLTDILSTLEDAEVLEKSRSRRLSAEREYSTRGITGRRAEEIFVNYFHAGVIPFRGELEDRCVRQPKS